ncbi:MAG: DNA translocase FtsK [Lachnospiraceae bacterium]|nr:DNA translocase FtsK [Lachnospiraceae bacterium]
MSGKVGAFVNGVLFGIFGIPAYIAPIVLVFVVLIYLANKNNMFAIRKCICASVLLVVVCSLIQMTNFDESYKITTYYTMSSTEKTGGGLIGGAMCSLLYELFGFGGGIVVLILMAIICGIIISEKTFMKAMTRALESITYKFQSRGAVAEVDEAEEEYQEEYPEDVADDYYDGYNDSEEDEEIKVAKPRKRRAKTFNIFKSFTEAKSEESNEEVSDNEVNNEDSNLEDNDLDEETNDYDDNYEVQDTMNEESEEFDDIAEQEMSHKFGSTSQEYDIRNLADRLISGNLDNIPEVDFDADNLTFEQLTTDDVFDAKSGKMHEVSPTTTSKAIITKDTLISPYETVVTHGQSHIGTGGNMVSGETVTQIIRPFDTTPKKTRRKYVRPPYKFLKPPFAADTKQAKEEQKETAKRLQETFDSFGVGAKLTNISAGPAVTRYEVQPNQGVKVSKITNLADDIKLNLAAADIRIEAPIPGKAAVGIEVPNKGENSTVMLRELIESKEFKTKKSDLAFAVGKDISGQVVIADIAKMPHLLIAGQTGAGKSVCINTLIMSLLYKASPDDVKLIMIDPKVVELSVYNGIPHLLVPVVTDPKKASGALNWALQEMTERYQKFAEAGVRDITSFNEKIESIPNPESLPPRYQKMPQIVIIIDELADLMMVAPGEVEDAICRLAQMARAAGLHLIIATQRPSVNVITGLIKANVPSRIAFSVASAIDSRTIIDGGGAEKLLGKGDMLFYPSGYPKPVRVQGAFISDKEVSDVVTYLKQFSAGYDDVVDKQITSAAVEKVEVQEKKATDKDEYFIEAGRFVIEKDKASIGMLQRVYKIGFNRAARIMDQLCEAGVVSGEDGTKPRNILMTHDQFNQYIEECL